MDLSAELKQKYEWLSLTEIEQIIKRAKFIYISLRFPADESVDISRYNFTYRQNEWLFAACEEIIERLGISSELAHRENGVSKDYDSAHISKFLTSLVKPVIGTIGDKNEKA